MRVNNSRDTSINDDFQVRSKRKAVDYISGDETGILNTDVDFRKSLVDRPEILLDLVENTIFPVPPPLPRKNKHVKLVSSKSLGYVKPQHLCTTSPPVSSLSVDSSIELDDFDDDIMSSCDDSIRSSENPNELDHSRTACDNHRRQKRCELEESKWNKMFNALVKYGNEHGGNCNVPQHFIGMLEDGTSMKLGAWLSNQRQHKKGKGGYRLLPEREKKLQELVDIGKLSWVMELSHKATDDEKWNTMLEALVQYGDEHNGNCNVPYHYIATLADGSTVKLGTWLSSQRQHYRGHTKMRLAENREAKLQRLVDEGRLVWLMDSSYRSPAKWDCMFDALLKYGEEHDGNCNVPNTYIEVLPDGSTLNLGSWLHHQRQYKKGHGGTLQYDRERRLQELVDSGRLEWDLSITQKDRKWETMFTALLKYGEDHGGCCNVPPNYVITLRDGSSLRLGEWLVTQCHRRYGRGGFLREDRARKLQDLLELGLLTML